ncbi:hypothetical protein EMCRGX_G002814 [Ephydatia muelleri]
MSGQSRCFPTASACTRQKSLPHWYHSRGPHQEPATNVANSAIGGVNALNVWSQGYVLPFTSVPTPYLRPNQHSAHAEAEFVDSAVAELVAEGYVEKVEQKPTVCSPLSVVANGVGKKRLVVNLRHVNRYLMVQKFKYQDLRVDVMSAGVLPLLKNLEDPELQRIAQSLPATVLRSRADSTTKKYVGAYQRWKTWAEARHEVPAFPVQAVHLALYLRHLSESVQSKAAVEEAVHALSWLHEVAGLEPVSSVPIVQATLSGLSLHSVHFMSSVLTTKEIDELTLIQVIITPTNASQELIELLCGLLEKDPAMRLGITLYSSTQHAAPGSCAIRGTAHYCQYLVLQLRVPRWQPREYSADARHTKMDVPGFVD